MSGRSARTAASSPRSQISQFGPWSSDARRMAPDRCARKRTRHGARRSRASGASQAWRAARARRCGAPAPSPSTRTGSRPAAHSWISAIVRRDAAGFEQRVRGADARMAGERQFAARREDAHAIVGAGLRRRQHERRFGQIRPGRDALHVGIGQAFGVENHGERVADETVRT